jgi:hypothetical protein
MTSHSEREGFSKLSTSFNFQPVIIIGAARSGTNMLRDALTRLDGVATWPCDEINYIWRHHSALFPTDELRPIHATHHVKRFVRTAFQRLADRTQANCIVEKTCANSLRVDYVRDILPEAKFVFIVRDGRDVVASAIKRWQAVFDLKYTLKKARYVPLSDVPLYAARFAANWLHRLTSRDRRLASWGPRFDGIDEMAATRSLAEVCAAQWSRTVRLAADSLAKIPPDQVCSLRYESFVADPKDHIHQLAAFVGVSPSRKQPHSPAPEISTRSIGNWRRDLDSATLAAIDPQFQLAQLALERFEHAHQPLGVRRSAA